MSLLTQAAEMAKNKAYDVQSALITAEIYSQLAALYLSKYLHQPEAKIAEDFFTYAFAILKKFDIPPCDQARFKWKYARIKMFQSLDYHATIKLLNDALKICTTQCKNDIYLQGRIYGFLGGSLLRDMEVKRAKKLLDKSIQLINHVVGESSRKVEYIRRAEANIMLGEYAQAYEDCQRVFGPTLAERNHLFDLILYINLYHAGFIKYKLLEFEKSIEHFGQFIDKIHEFSNSFLDMPTYQSLKKSGVFEKREYNALTAKRDIEIYLNNSVVIFSHIYSKNHGFVKNYIAPNAS